MDGPPIDRAVVRRPGRDVTLIAYGGMVATALEAARVLHRRRSRTLPARRACGRGTASTEVIVLDLVYVAVIVATFVIVGLIAKGVEKL